MQENRFEWDDAKNAANFSKHGVTFERASLVFSDLFAIDQQDDRFNYAEERHSITAMVEGTLLFVIYVERGDRVRIISARRANTYEQDDYYRQNS